MAFLGEIVTIFEILHKHFYITIGLPRGISSLTKNKARLLYETNTLACKELRKYDNDIIKIMFFEFIQIHNVVRYIL
jgi:hypothetical protein